MLVSVPLLPLDWVRLCVCVHILPFKKLHDSNDHIVQNMIIIYPTVLWMLWGRNGLLFTFVSSATGTDLFISKCTQKYMTIVL